MSCLFTIAKQFEQVIDYSQGFKPAQSKQVIKQWFKAKKPFIKKLGGFIYEYPETITTDLSDVEKRMKISDFTDWVERKYGLDDLSNFITANEKTFFENAVAEEYKYKDIVIPKGMKLLKAFKYFEENKDILNDIQNVASMSIQENKISGKLCLSVHPLDFLSSSENTLNWRSCHALDGEYRAGNLSYMLDGSTIICYLKTDEEVKLPRFPSSVPWNNKKWRCLLFFSENNKMIFAGRPYPFAANGLLNKIRDIVQELKLIEVLNQPYWRKQYLSEWRNDYVDTFNFSDGTQVKLESRFILDCYSELVPLEAIITNGQGSCHYNDLLYSSCYVPYYVQVESGDHVPKYKNYFKIGARTLCLNCGKYEISDPDSMLCEDCLDYYDSEDCLDETFCSECGAIIEEGEGEFAATGEFLCPHCVEEYTQRCYKCNERYYQNDMSVVRDEDNTHVHWVCANCKE